MDPITLSMLGSAAKEKQSGIQTTLLGGAELAGGILAQRRAKKLEPPPEDTEQRRFLNELMRRRRAMMTGSAYTETLREIRSQQAATQRGMERAAGGAGGALIAGLARTQRAAGSTFSELAAREEEKALGYTQLVKQMIDQISQRKLELQMSKYTQALLDAQGLKRAGLSQITSGLAQMSGGDTSEKDTSGLPGMGQTPGMGEPSPGINELPFEDTLPITEAAAAGIAT